MNATYSGVWSIYQSLGWSGVLPLRTGTKYPPPDGFTGWDGIDPSGPDCAEFDQLPAFRDTVQCVLRMPSIVSGLDVDAYDRKTGGRTLAEGIRRWGPLPAGPWSSARDNGTSGIRFFRVPDGTVLVSNIVFPELQFGHVEVIQRHHRYALVWPSIHPDLTAPYTWRGTARPDVPPAVADLPELPLTWLNGLAGTGRQGERARPEQVAQFLADLPTGTACQAVRAAVRGAQRALVAPVRSRHDDTLAAVLRLLRLGERGHPGVPAALVALENTFVAAVVADGSRTPVSAHAEYSRIRDGEQGIGIIKSTPTPTGQGGCRCPVSPPTRGQLVGMVRAVLNAQGPERSRLLTWATGRLRTAGLAGDLDETYVRSVVEQLHQAATGAGGNR